MLPVHPILVPEAETSNRNCKVFAGWRILRQGDHESYCSSWSCICFSSSVGVVVLTVTVKFLGLGGGGGGP